MCSAAWRCLKDGIFSAISNFFGHLERRFAVSADSIAVLLLFTLALVSALICLPIMLCCSRSKRKENVPYSRKDILCKKGLFALMLARLDEFDTLTPLILTPAASTSSSSESTKKQSPKRQNQHPRGLPPIHRSSSSNSPPPPRRSSQGKTLIVPLTTSRYRAPAAPLLGTPDSRVTTFEGGTTKSCATIPEDDEEEFERIEDLVSIDRTSYSLSEHKSHRYFSPSSYNLLLPNAPPEFQIPVPSYGPPEVPQPEPQRPLKLATQKEEIRNEIINHSIGSPDSSITTGSPIDTTGSLSDSFYINSDVISSTNGSQFVDPNGGNESDGQSKYQLHRIEEESELAADDGHRAAAYANSQNVDVESNILIPRSISQQFELLRR